MRPVLFFLHGLGLSARAAEPLVPLLPDFDVVGIDLPGFGDEPAGATDVEGMADHVVRRIAARAPARWVLAGHSMGGKVATVVAARTISGDAPLFGLAGVVLLAGSPTGPEPMDDQQRSEMLGWVAGPGAGLDARDARAFIDANVAGPLTAELDDLAMSDVRRSDREAWAAWLRRGSREDWTEQVGLVDLPALVLAGAEDGPLGETAQRELNAPVFARARIEVVVGAAHFLTLEQPRAVAAAIQTWWMEDAGRGAVVPADYAAMLASDRVASHTRGVLARRVVADDPAYVPRVLDDAQLTTLRAVAARVVPQGTPRRSELDLAARVDSQLAEGVGDGWRPAGQPVDVVAYRAGLDALAGLADLDGVEQDRRLTALGPDPWFEDCRTDLVRQWLAHPATMARIGFDGVATGGDGLRKQGFTLLTLGGREQWEPAMQPATEEVSR